MVPARNRRAVIDRVAEWAREEDGSMPQKPRDSHAHCCQPTVIQPSYAVSTVTFLSYAAVVSRSQKHDGGFQFTSAFQLPNCDAPFKRVIASQWQCCPRQAARCVLCGSHKAYRARISANERPLPRQRSCKGDRPAEKRSDPRRDRSASIMRTRGGSEVSRASSPRAPRRDSDASADGQVRCTRTRARIVLDAE